MARKGKGGSHMNAGLFRDPRTITAPECPCKDAQHTMQGGPMRKRKMRGQTHFKGGGPVEM